MPITARIGLAALGAAVLSSAPAAASVERPAASRSVAERAALRQLVQLTGAPGGAMAVERGTRRWVGAAGVADVDARTRVLPSTRFRVGDVTQTFIAAAMLAAMDEGATHLAERAAEFLYDLRSDVLLLHLLTHTSGLLPNGRRVPPGPFEYNQRNYVLLTYVLEGATGSGVATELQTRIFRPLRLSETAFSYGAPVRRLARGYRSGAPRSAVPRRLAGGLARAAGVTSTPRDLARFMRAVVSGRLLSERRTRELTEHSVRVRKFPGVRFGLGVFSVKTPCGLAWGHRGRMDGYTTWVFATSDGERVVAASVNVGRLTQARVLRAERIVRRRLCA